MGHPVEKPRHRRCAYCGCHNAQTIDHVISRALYPPSKARSRVARITVPACEPCNACWTDDEPHFRNVLLVAGEPNAAVRELWEGKTRRSFTYADGYRRVRDLALQMEPVETANGPGHMIFPAQDERVLRIVRKIVRGLCHHHELLSPVPDNQVLVDIHRFTIPEQFLSEMTYAHVETDVFEYRYALVDEPEIHSGWLLNFYGRTPFLCIIFRSEAALRQAKMVAPAMRGRG